MSSLRALAKIPALALLGAVIIPAQLFIAGPLFKDTETLPDILWKGIRKIMGIKVDFNAAAVRRDKPMLYMANHVSVLDPFIIASISRNSGFVAMKRLGDWPIVGTFAKKIGTVLASNNQSAGALPQIHEQLTGLLNSGRNVTFCPEGKITDGRSVAEFKTGIISIGFNNLSAGSLKREIGYQPFALRMTRIDGKDLDKAPSLKDSYLKREGDGVLQQAWRLLKMKSLEVELTALPDMDPANYKSAHELAEAARQQIMSYLFKSPPQPAST